MNEAGILVTGATGNVGSEVCRYLAGGAHVSGGHRVSGAVRPATLDARGSAADRVAAALHGAEPRAFDLTDSTTWEPALEGVGKVFLVRPPRISNVRRDMRPFIERMRERRIGHVVFLSVQGAENTALIPHSRIERTIIELEIPYTFIRPSFFMQNLSTTHLPEIRDERRIFVPAGDGRTNFVDVRDVAEACAVALLNESHKGAAYTITGTESYSYYEVAERLSKELGREIRYEPARLLPFLSYQLSRGRKLVHAIVMYALYSAARMGKADGTTDTFQKLVGRGPHPLSEFLRDHRNAFVGAPSA
ncbi:MAG: SDR family oxidoreductase [Spirochaetota bacterium]